MVKKLLLIFLIFTSSIIFSQEKVIDQITVSPNPFTSETTINFQSTETSGDLIFLVKNVLGKTVYKKQYKVKKGKNKIKFLRGDLSAGMYIYSLQTSKKIVSKRFVIR